MALLLFMTFPSRSTVTRSELIAIKFEANIRKMFKRAIHSENTHAVGRVLGYCIRMAQHGINNKVGDRGTAYVTF